MAATLAVAPSATPPVPQLTQGADYSFKGSVQLSLIAYMCCPPHQFPEMGEAPPTDAAFVQGSTG
jgi:hypothetical protein